MSTVLHPLDMFIQISFPAFYVLAKVMCVYTYVYICNCHISWSWIIKQKTPLCWQQSFCLSVCLSVSAWPK